MNDKIKKWGAAALVIVAAAGAYVAWSKLDPAALPAGIVAGNGRIEAVEIDISTRTYKIY